MPKPIVTKLFFASLAGSVMGAVIAAGPLFWSMMKIDLSSTTEVEGGAVPLFFGLFEFNYSSLVLLVNEALLCGIALGVSASLMWFETRLDGAQLGSIADIASGLNALGAIFAFAADAEEMLEDLCRPAKRRIRKAEQETQLRSEVAQRLYDRVPKLAALALVGPSLNEDGDDRQALADWETRWVELTLGLCEDLLHFGLVSEPRSFSGTDMRDRLAPIIELADLIKIADKQAKGEN